MYNKRSILFIILPLFIACLQWTTASAQSMAQAEASLEKFNHLRASGATEPAIYDALYQCYKDYAGVLEGAARNTPAYVQSRNSLQELWPHLQAGASYHSSHGNNQKALTFAQAYLDVTLMDAFKDEQFVHDDYFSTMAYFAASGTFNSRDYARAINYFRIYLDTGDKKHRQNVYKYMAKACMEVKDYDLAMSVLDECTNDYPNDFSMLTLAINNCMDRRDYANLQKFVTKGLSLKPNDETLLNIQGKIYEDTQQFQKALSFYRKWQQSKPNSLPIAQHVALSYYNLGVQNYNNALMEQNEGTARKLTRQANDYFSAASETLETIVANKPTAVKYLQALALAYSCMGNVGKLEEVNAKLSAIGGTTIAENAVPPMMDFEGNKVVADNGKATPKPKPVDPTPSAAIPPYSEFATGYINAQLAKWQEKSQFESTDSYVARVNKTTYDAEVARLKMEAQDQYIKKYAARVRFDDFLLRKYDADNEAYLVESKYGDMVVPVPLKNNEAQVFDSGWAKMQFKDPKFCIDNDQLMLAGLTFVTPQGKSYRYDSTKELAYADVVVQPFSGAGIVIESDKSETKPKGGHTKVIDVPAVSSDVDSNIPQSRTSNDNTYAVIIANEDYEMVAKVPLARHDGEVFAEYCKKTLGIPERNVLFFPDATFGYMRSAVSKLKARANVLKDEMKVIFYYAGHGIPDEKSRDAYLLPVDSDGKDMAVCYSLNSLYNELGNLGSQSVVVFLDACFSGAKRDDAGGMLLSARAVALKPKAAELQGNMVVFSAVSDDETAMPYTEKGHGMFTYFLLKKLQESKGNITLQGLSTYVSEKVSRESIDVNEKQQTPTVKVSDVLSNSWQKMKLNGE